MDADQIFATGGVSGITGLALFVVYKFFSGKWKVKSMCCGREISVETNEDPTEITVVRDEDPKEIVIKNPINK